METVTVSDFIEAEGIETEAKHVGTGCPWSEGWDCDAWKVTFTIRGEQVKRLTVDYYTGVGHRKARNGARNPYPPRTYDAIRWNERHVRPVAPSGESVLDSLRMDAEALNMSFPDWANEMGFNPDSLKDEKTYNACVHSGARLRSFLGYAGLKRLQVTERL